MADSASHPARIKFRSLWPVYAVASTAVLIVVVLNSLTRFTSTHNVENNDQNPFITTNHTNSSRTGYRRWLRTWKVHGAPPLELTRKHAKSLTNVSEVGQNISAPSSRQTSYYSEESRVDVIPESLLEDLRVGSALSIRSVWSGGSNTLTYPFNSSVVEGTGGAVRPLCIDPSTVSWGSWTATPRIVQVHGAAVPSPTFSRYYPCHPPTHSRYSPTRPLSRPSRTYCLARNAALAA